MIPRRLQNLAKAQDLPSSLNKEFDNLYKHLTNVEVSVDTSVGLTLTGSRVGAKIASASQTGMLSKEDYARFSEAATGIVVPGGVSDTDRTRWDAAYTHSQLVSGNPHHVSYSELYDPTSSKKFTFGTANYTKFAFTTTPSGDPEYIGSFDIVGNGTLVSDLVAVHQDTGTPTTGATLLHLYATSANVTLFRASQGGSDKVVIEDNGVNLYVPLVSTFSGRFGNVLTSNNSISTLDVNGDLYIDANGSGVIRIATSSYGELMYYGANADPVFMVDPSSTLYLLAAGATQVYISGGTSPAYIRFGTTGAQTGEVRLHNNQAVGWRNSGNTGDIALYVGSDNIFHAQASLVMDAGSGGSTYNSVQYSGAKATNNAATLYLSLSANSQSSFYWRHTQASATDNDSYLSGFAPDATEWIRVQRTKDALYGGNITYTSGKYQGSVTYVSGFFGAGWRLDQNLSAANASYLEIDNIVVRNTLRTHIFQKDIVRATNGYLFISDASEIAAESSTTDTPKYLYAKENVFQVNDLVWYKDVDVDTGTITGIQIQIATVDGSVTLPNSTKTGYRFTYTVYSGSGTFKVGGTLVRVGNTGGTRGGSIYFDASSPSTAPFMDIYDEVTSWVAFGSTAKLKLRVGQLSGITLGNVGMLGGYGIYTRRGFFDGDVHIYGELGTSSVDGATVSPYFYVGKLNKNEWRFDSQLVSGWDKGADISAVTDNFYTSPSGIADASQIASTATTNAWVGDNNTSTSRQSKTFVFSFWARTNSGTETGVVLQSYDGAGVTHDLATVSLTTSWQRFSAVYTFPASGTYYGFRVKFTAAGTSRSVWGAQAEQVYYSAAGAGIYYRTLASQTLEQTGYGLWAVRGGFGNSPYNPIVRLSDVGMFVRNIGTLSGNHGVSIGKDVATWSGSLPATYGSNFGVFGYNAGNEVFALRHDGTAQIAGWTFDNAKFSKVSAGAGVEIDSVNKVFQVLKSSVAVVKMGDFTGSPGSYSGSSTTMVGDWSANFNPTTTKNASGTTTDSWGYHQSNPSTSTYMLIQRDSTSYGFPWDPSSNGVASCQPSAAGTITTSDHIIELYKVVPSGYAGMPMNVTFFLGTKNSQSQTALPTDVAFYIYTNSGNFPTDVGTLMYRKLSVPSAPTLGNTTWNSTAYSFDFTYPTGATQCVMYLMFRWAYGVSFAPADIKIGDVTFTKYDSPKTYIKPDGMEIYQSPNSYLRISSAGVDASIPLLKVNGELRLGENWMFKIIPSGAAPFGGSELLQLFYWDGSSWTKRGYLDPTSADHAL